ncbi:MAG: sigma-70 family RNA polymerase sigma factor [Planctomycetes bacterium]|nr:sigma-70 family RNA polymerase sigma factor [Planctomycetota bacterium]
MAAPDPRKTSSAPRDEAPPGPADSSRASRGDIDLVRRLLAGDEAAFTSLVAAHHGALLRLAQIFVTSRHVAEEVVQETWLAVLGGIGSFEGRSSLKTWIFRILMNRARTIGAREGRSIPFSSLEEPEGDTEPALDPSRFRPGGGWGRPPGRWDGDTPEKILLRKEVLGQIEEAIRRLPAGQRAVVTLRDIEGCGSDEACNILELSETNQRVLLHRARSKIRALLEPYIEEL